MEPKIPALIKLLSDDHADVGEIARAQLAGLGAAAVPFLEEAARSHADPKGRVEAQVYSVPENIDKQIAKLKLDSMGVQVDKLTPDQEQYLASWSEGT